MDLKLHRMIDLIEKKSSRQEPVLCTHDFIVIGLCYYYTLYLSGHSKSYLSYINPDVTLLQSVEMPLNFKEHLHYKSGVYK
jgi:hypothetical protein